MFPNSYMMVTKAPQPKLNKISVVPKLLLSRIEKRNGEILVKFSLSDCHLRDIKALLEYSLIKFSGVQAHRTHGP